MSTDSEIDEPPHAEFGGEPAEDTIGEYEGDRNVELERHGEGRTILPNGDYYEGQYIHNMRHGLGLYIFMKSGARYLGQYEKGKKCGLGSFFYPDGSVYEGEWKSDKKHGYGIYLYPNGDSYEGQWRDDLREGMGYYMFKKVGAKFLGSWKEGIIDGLGQIMTRHYRYHGKWDNNLPIGKGVFTFKEDAMVHGIYTQEINEPIRNSESEMFGEVSSKEMAKSETFAKWKTLKVTKFDPTLLPPEPQPFEYPESTASSTSRSALSFSEALPARTVCPMPDAAVFDKYYVDEPLIAAADSWDSNIKVNNEPVIEDKPCPKAEPPSDLVLVEENTAESASNSEQSMIRASRDYN